MPEFQFGFNELEDVKHSINEYINSKKHDKNLFLLKHSSELYSQSNMISLKILLDKGFKGVFISFQRPRKNLDQWLKKNKIDERKLKILDYSSQDRENVAGLYKEIFDSLETISNDKKFVFIDSLNTMALCNSEMWVDDFTDRLMDNLGGKTFENTIVVVNVAKELSKQNIVKNFVSYADGVLDISNPKGKYSSDLTKNSVFT